MITKNIKQQIKEYFFINPTDKLRLRQIEKKLKLPFPSVVRYTKELEKEGILKSTIISNVKLYSADRVSRSFLVEKRLFNICLLYSSGLIDYFIDKYSNPAIIVFGSYARGEDIEKSDIDIYVETQSKQTYDLRSFEKKLQRKLQIFKCKCLASVDNKELANNIVNGVVLNGFVEVFR